MTATTYEEAKICPRCKKPGVEVSERLVPTTLGIKLGTKVITIECRTPLCPWENTPWFVQLNPDGTIPPPQDHSRTPKVYQMPKDIDNITERIERNVQKQIEAETKPGGGEVRRG